MVSTGELAGLDERERELVHSGPPPTGSQAMKAVLNRAAFSDPAWVYERKLDGIRCIAIRDGDAISMLSRNDLDLGSRYPEVRTALAAQSPASSGSASRSGPYPSRPFVLRKSWTRPRPPGAAAT